MRNQKLERRNKVSMKTIINSFKKREKYWFDKIAPFLGDETVKYLKLVMVLGICLK